MPEKSGILLLDKPLAISSNLALQKAKRLLQANKAGHSGSLDPQASGMLPICLGEATKFSQFLLAADKCYEFVMHLGVTTTTGDSEGMIMSSKVPQYSSRTLEKMVADFHGTLAQIPPMYSAIKYQGKPLYKMARLGQSVERAARPITIHQLICQILEKDKLHCTVICSKGTYIRTLAEDMGTYLGCGAHVASLRRLWCAPFQTQKMITLAELESLVPLLSIAQVLSCLLPVIYLCDHYAFCLRRGQSIEALKGLTGEVVLMTFNGEFFGVGKAQLGQIKPQRLLSQNLVS